HAQEGRWNGGRILARACVLAVEQGFQLSLQIGLAAVGGSSLERVHRRPVVRPELGNKLRRCSREGERVRIPLERDHLLGHTRARALPASTRLLAMSTPNTSAPNLAAGNAVVPSPQPRSSTSSPSLIPNLPTSTSPLSRMLSAIRVKSPFSQSALFAFIHGSFP